MECQDINEEVEWNSFYNVQDFLRDLTGNIHVCSFNENTSSETDVNQTWKLFLETFDYQEFEARKKNIQF